MSSSAEAPEWKEYRLLIFDIVITLMTFPFTVHVLPGLTAQNASLCTYLIKLNFIYHSLMHRRSTVDRGPVVILDFLFLLSTVLSILAASAKLQIRPPAFSSKSSIYLTNYRGPRTDHYSTPLITGTQSRNIDPPLPPLAIYHQAIFVSCWPGHCGSTNI